MDTDGYLYEVESTHKWVRKVPLVLQLGTDQRERSNARKILFAALLMLVKM